MMKNLGMEQKLLEELVEYLSQADTGGEEMPKDGAKVEVLSVEGDPKLAEEGGLAEKLKEMVANKQGL